MAHLASFDHGDFRCTDYKRAKDVSLKWAHGMRPARNPAAPDKLRPVSMDQHNHHQRRHHHSAVKLPRGSGQKHKQWLLPAGAGASGRMRAQADALLETEHVRRHGSGHGSSLSGSLDLDSGSSSASNVLYSYDNTDSPPPALTLDLFVKPATARATAKLVERLVEKEYEVLDEHGDAVRGHKARQMLRHTGSGAAAAAAAAAAEKDMAIIDDDFELV